ncbi:DUF202 domain-containing protein [Acetobacter sp. TBRC 12305]|uniref:DUF202 domain-containing protein n=1 Tax=Acetobacter garciniae TaxID=2817435 RepID=A0A939HLZ5_9PROT|nr:DUF202 domain-containing protein [Acetobacter garciniae]MBO1324486.1 DUF202 domain-containing protein [Acetobacter garciniae]MBX0344175.1 DUF202 domain-containing protein [Acetobacter garciniae]
MQRPADRPEPLKWWQSGTRPDYRFSLANERTFLAWIRTAMGLIVGAVALEQFSASLASPRLRLVLAMVLFCCATLISAMAYLRWARAEHAMRQETDLPQSRLLPFLTVLVALLAVILALFVVFA